MTLQFPLQPVRRRRLLALLAVVLTACEPAPLPMTDSATRVQTLTIALQEGFDDDHVVVRSAGDVVADLPAVTTDVRIGLAQEVEVEVVDWPVAVEVTLPDRGLHGAASADDGQAIGVSVVGEGVVLRVSEGPFGYL